MFGRRSRGRPDALEVRCSNCDALEPEIAERGFAVGPATERPAIFALAFLDRQVVDAGEAAAHQSIGAEFPVLVAIAAEPVAAVIVPLVSKAHGNAIVLECPEFLGQAVVEFTLPLAGKE